MVLTDLRSELHKQANSMQLSGGLNSKGNQLSKNKVTKQEYKTISNSKRNQCQEPKSEKLLI